jgi:MFS family permease
LTVETERGRPGSRLGWLTEPMTVAVTALGITQITAWGTSYYCLGVLAPSIAKEFGWSRGFVFLGFTVSLLVMALISAAVGRMMDRVGARIVMTVGSVVLAAALLLLSMVTTDWAYLLVWALVGVGMRLTLYDAAMVALVQVTPTRGRLAISYLTLYGAFASSIFWVIGHYLDEAMGWRQTIVVFAALNILVCLPLHWFGLARREGDVATPAGKPGVAQATQPGEPPLEGVARVIGMVLFGLVMSLSGLVFGILSVQLVPVLEGAGLGPAAAVWMASLKGVAQFGGRVVELAFGRNLSAMAVARLALGSMAAAFGLLYVSEGNFWALLAFTLLMGAAQGVITIVRGAVPLALFGPKGFGVVMGLIATPILIVSALSPTIFAAVVDQFGWSLGNVVMLTAALAAFLCMEAMALWHRRHVRRQAAGGQPIRPTATPDPTVESPSLSTLTGPYT